MPRYCYRCEFCKEVFEVSHGMFFEQERCTKCNKEGGLVKQPFFNIKKCDTTVKKKKVGTVVDEYIKDAKQDLKKQKNDLKTEIFDK